MVGIICTTALEGVILTTIEELIEELSTNLESAKSSAEHVENGLPMVESLSEALDAIVHVRKAHAVAYGYFNAKEGEADPFIGHMVPGIELHVGTATTLARSHTNAQEVAAFLTEAQENIKDLRQALNLID